MEGTSPNGAAPPPELIRSLGANVYRLRVLNVPRITRERLADLADVAHETIRVIEDTRDPSKPPKNVELDTVERLAAGFRKAGVAIDARDLFATPSKVTGRRDHLSLVPHTGEALPKR